MHLRTSILAVFSAALAVAALGQAEKSRRLHSQTKVATLSPQQLFNRVSRSVVVIEVLDNPDSVIARGSGVVVAPELVITNRHVVDAGEIWRVKQRDTSPRAYVKYVDPDHDLAELSVSGLKADSVPLRVSASLKVGERVYAIGSPRGLELTLSDGLISGLREYQRGTLIQTSAPISQGSSGGGLFDAQGRLVGITSSGIIDGENLNFALPSDWILPMIQPQRLFRSVGDVSDSERLLAHAATAVNNLETLVQQRRILSDPSYKIPPHAEAASWLIANAAIECTTHKDSPDCDTNWPFTQRAALEMLNLRIEIRRSRPSREGLEESVIAAAERAWTELRDAYCREAYHGYYTDLDDNFYECPDRPASFGKSK
jgi:hypothetical protein